MQTNSITISHVDDRAAATSVDRWSVRRSAAFVIAASAFFWAALVAGFVGLFWALRLHSI